MNAAKTIASVVEQCFYMLDSILETGIEGSHSILFLLEDAHKTMELVGLQEGALYTQQLGKELADSRADNIPSSVTLITALYQYLSDCEELLQKEQARLFLQNPAEYM